MKKVAVILFNLGGPDNLAAVKPFLFNLFNDSAIIRLPHPFRFFLAKIISFKREKIAQEIYNHIGGKSPILQETGRQAIALEKLLNGGDVEYKVFISMRYWKPFSAQTIKQVEEYGADEVVLLPLYPQYSTTTTQSSFDDWVKLKSKIPTRKIISYHLQKDFIKAHAELIKPYLEKSDNLRILFSAHGLPKQIADLPEEIYPQQINETVDSIAKLLGNVDYKVCYQSRVGRLEWIGPSIDEELQRAANDKKDVVIVPIAFVSEHSETLVELDIEYIKIAEKLGISKYYRVPALGNNELFIQCLADLVKQ